VSWPLAAGAALAALVVLGLAPHKGAKNTPSRGSSPERDALLREALDLEGTLYQWGGGRSAGDYGVDCSGLVILASKRAGVKLPPCPLATSNGWWQCLPRVSDPRPGDLALYGYAAENRAVHVELVLSFDGEDAETLGANGGDKDVLSPEVAKERGAFVRHATTRGRANFLGFVRNPVDEPLTGEPVPVDTSILQEDEALRSL